MAGLEDSTELIGRGHLSETSPLWTCQAAFVFRPLAHELNETDGAALLNYMVSNVRDHVFRQGPLEDEGGYESGESIGDCLFDHHGPDPVAQSNEASTVEAEDRLQHVRKQMNVEQPARGPQAHQLPGYRQLSHTWEPVDEV